MNEKLEFPAPTLASCLGGPWCGRAVKSLLNLIWIPDNAGFYKQTNDVDSEGRVVFRWHHDNPTPAAK